jgi:phosphoribosyl 1,2-cyclic phosphodiesterase
MPVQFAVLASGSRGNATLIQSAGAGMLIDVGIGPRAIAKRLESVGSSWDRLSSAILTHTHGDHIDDGTLLGLARRKLPLYCHEGHRDELARHGGFQMLAQQDLVRFYDDRPFLAPTGLRIEPIELSHDGGPTFGFRIESRSKRRGSPVAVGYLADTGCWSDAMAEMLAEVDLLGVEFNHDVEMQRLSGRSPYLIARNLGDRGHLSNDQGAALIAAVLARSSKSALRHVVLLHLSQQCNLPDLALGAARQAIRGTRRRINVHAARQSPAFPNLLVEPRRRRTSSASGAFPA